MNNENLLTSISYLEFINNIDNLVFDLLYSPNNGFTGLLSKNAVTSAQGYLEKFNHEAEKIKRQVDFNNADKIIEDKKNDLIKQIKKHYNIQVVAWADEVYQNMIENCFLQASAFRDDKDIQDKIYAKILSCVSWMANIHNLTDDEMSKIIKINLDKFYRALNSNDSDFIPKASIQKTDPNSYLEIRDLILKDKDKFLTIDFNSLNDKLDSSDIQKFNRIKNDIQTSKINSIKDDILLINSAIDVLKIKNNDEKYNFIKLVENDFYNSDVQTDNLDENKKIELIKRRMKLFKNSLNNDSISEYFKSRITS